MRGAIAASIIVFVGACAARVAEPPALPPARSQAEAATGTDAELRLEVRAPARVPYDPSALGVAGQTVALQITNRGGRAARVSPLRASFTATHEGVAFPCRAEASAPARAREPEVLEPGQSFAFKREMPCTLALPGRYDVRVAVRVDDAPELPGAFAIELEPGALVPQPLPSRLGVFAILVGARPTGPASERTRAVLAVINGGKARAELGRAKVSLSVYRGASPTPCAGRVESVALPDVIEPGAVAVAPVPLDCVPPEEGDYALVGHLTLGADSIDLGRVALHVSKNPPAYDPSGPPFR